MSPGSSTLSPPLDYLLQLTSLTDYFFHLPGFFLLFPQCGAWSQAIQEEQYKTSTHSTGYVYAWVDQISCLIQDFPQQSKLCLYILQFNFSNLNFSNFQ